ncbi:MAG TPA: hypothetical protein VKM93_10315 [Terriglobia bacterium]|nr:hypothetical protein [Terriglobia bacterium]
MESHDRPTLSHAVEEEIESEQIESHRTHREQLQGMMRATYPLGEPPPKRPKKLCNILRAYAVDLFIIEAYKYPPDPRMDHWLAVLAARIGKTVMDTLPKPDASIHTFVNLTYHARTEEMQEAVSEALTKEVQDYLSKWAFRRTTPNAESTAPEPERLKATITSPAAARRMEKYLRDNGIGLTDFASRAQTTDRTLRSFRKTGKVRRDIFEGIAKAMGTTKADLLKDPPIE